MWRQIQEQVPGTYQQPWSAACDAPHKLRQEKRSNVTEKNSATRSIHTRSDSRSTYVSSACRSAVRLSAVSCRLMSLLNVLDTTPLDTILHVHQYIVWVWSAASARVWIVDCGWKNEKQLKEKERRVQKPARPATKRQETEDSSRNPSSTAGGCGGRHMGLSVRGIQQLSSHYLYISERTKNTWRN